MTMPQLIQIALNEEDEDKAWDAVTVLQFRGTQEVLEAAQRLCESRNPEERELGANILGQLGVPQPFSLTRSFQSCQSAPSG